MAVRDKASRAGNLATSARDNPYVRLLMEDPQLRENLRSAYESARDAYGRLSNGKGPARGLLEDKKVHRDLERSLSALRDVGIALREGPKKRKKRRLGRILVLAIVGGALALVFSEGLRNKVLDALFGAEEEFDYTSTTVPADASSAPPPASTPPAAESSGGGEEPKAESTSSGDGGSSSG